jgi:hypothetical protein
MTAASVLNATDLRDLPATQRDSALAAISATLAGKSA